VTRLLAIMLALLACSGCASQIQGTIALGEGVNSAVVEEAVRDWVDASQGQIALVVLDKWDDNADYKIVLADFSTQDRCGLTTPHGSGATIQIDPFRDRCEDYENLVVHELGHALGSQTGGCDGFGHSDLRTDVMYPSMTHNHVPTAHDLKLLGIEL
jgi:uncharacterized protein YceK